MHDDVVHDDGSAYRNFQIFDYHVLYDVDEHVIVFSKSWEGQLDDSLATYYDNILLKVIVVVCIWSPENCGEDNILSDNGLSSATIDGFLITFFSVDTARKSNYLFSLLDIFKKEKQVCRHNGEASHTIFSRGEF